MSDVADDKHHDDVHVAAIMWTGVAICVALTLAALAAYAFEREFMPMPAEEGPNASRPYAIEGPVLESAPSAERDAYMANKERQLHTYAWIDPVHGIARIPIEDAMRILAERGTKAPAGDAIRRRGR